MQQVATPQLQTPDGEHIVNSMISRPVTDNSSSDSAAGDFRQTPMQNYDQFGNLLDSPQADAQSQLLSEHSPSEVRPNFMTADTVCVLPH